MKCEQLPVNDADRDAVFGAQSRLWRCYHKHGDGRKSWHTVAEKLGVNVKYVYDLVMYNKVPVSKEIRSCVFLPKTLPSEKHMRPPIPKIGQQDWQLYYFKKVKR